MLSDVLSERKKPQRLLSTYTIIFAKARLRALLFSTKKLVALALLHCLTHPVEDNVA